MSPRSHSIQRPSQPPQVVTASRSHGISTPYRLPVIAPQNSLSSTAQEFQAQSDQSRWRVAALLGHFLSRLYEYFYSLLRLGPIRAVAAIEDGDMSDESTNTQDGNNAMPVLPEANAVAIEGDELDDPFTNFEGSDDSSEGSASSFSEGWTSSSSSSDEGSSERSTSDEEVEGSQSDTNSSIDSVPSYHSSQLNIFPSSVKESVC